MFVLQTMLSAVFRAAGKILNTAFGWATVMLFGKVPRKRQILLSIMAFGAVLWIVVALGVLVPRVATFLLAFVTIPSWVETGWIRLLMLSLTLLLPFGVGVLAIYLEEPERRPKDPRAIIRRVLKGWPFTVGLAFTLLFMLIAAPILKIRDWLRGWDAAHVPMMVQSKDYPDVVADLQRVLREAGIECVQRRASWLLRLPIEVFTFFARASVEHLVTPKLTVLKCSLVEVLLYPSDLVIRGKELDVARVRSLLAEHLTFTKAYQTWTKEANRLEDRLVAIWKHIKNSDDCHDCLDELRTIEHDTNDAKLVFEEWEVLFRGRMIVERTLLSSMANVSITPDIPVGSQHRERTTAGAKHEHQTASHV